MNTIYDALGMEDEKDFDPVEEWVGMPEFKQGKVRPYKTLTVRFDNKEDYEEFARLINQNLTEKTKSIWHPYKAHKRGYKKVWRS